MTADNDDNFEDLYKDLPADEREYMQRYHKPDGVCFHCGQPPISTTRSDPSRSRSPTPTATRARTNSATGCASASGPLRGLAACSSSIGAERASCGAACASRYFLGSGLVGRRGGGVRQELAAGVADDEPSRRAGSASCAGLGRRVHHPVVAAVAIFALVLIR